MRPPPALIEQLRSSSLKTFSDGRHIAIIGGGWSGVAAAIHLLQQGNEDLRISLIERSPLLGRGVAYGTQDPKHILNVPAGRMSIDPEHPNEFIQYATQEGIAASENTLLPRQLYGDYVLDRLARSIQQAKGQIQIINDEAISLQASANSWTILFSSGASLTAGDVILSTGHGAPRLPEALQHLSSDTWIIGNPWSAAALSSIPKDAKLLMIGSGLTALDVLGSMRRGGRQGFTEVISLTGEWPRPHLASILWTGAAFPIDQAALPKTIDGLVVWFQEAMAKAKELKIPWQAVMDAFRPHTVSVWKGLSLEDRRRFLSHFRPTWELYRHRAPRPQLEALRRWEAEGWVKRTAATLHSAEKDGDFFLLELQEQGQTRQLRVDRIVIATGPESDVHRLSSPLWKKLLAESVVEGDPLRLGILTDDRGAVMRDGAVVPGLWALGSLLRPQFFESTAVPDLSKRAVALSGFILGVTR